MRVTFDTNTLVDVVSPTTSQRPSGAADGATVRAAIEAGAVQGFFARPWSSLKGSRKPIEAPCSAARKQTHTISTALRPTGMA